MNIPKTVLSLTTCIILADAASAASVVLYETGWEAAPTTPAWVPGHIAPQNGWAAFTSGFDSTAGHRVVVNGTPEASVNSLPVVTPHGNQFHRFDASSSTNSPIRHVAWVDLGAVFSARPSGMDLITSSVDLYVPSSQSQDNSTYGLVGYDTAGAVFAVLVSPAFRSIYLDDLVTFRSSPPEVFAFDTWFNVAIEANFATGEIRALVNGAAIETLVGTNLAIVGGTLLDVDLYVENSIQAPNPRTVFSDNYRVIAASIEPVRPALNVASIGPGRYRISWPASAGNWILESATALDRAEWTPCPEIVVSDGTTASVEIEDAASFHVFRLRQP